MIRIPGSLLLSFLLISLLFISSCSTTKKIISAKEQYHNAAYDDTSLTINNRDILLPYNRFIEPAGTIIKFGDPSLENHSLDCALLPDKTILVIEDRYGLAFLDTKSNSLIFNLRYGKENSYGGFMSTYSGIKIWEQSGKIFICWGAANSTNKKSYVMVAGWDGQKAVFTDAILFPSVSPAPMSLPNDIAIIKEGSENYLYVVLNGNNQLVKMRLSDKRIIWTTNTGMAPYGLVVTGSKVYVTNWAGPVPAVKSEKETAGIPYANVYIDQRTGATSMGTVSVVNSASGETISEIEVGLHPNAIIASSNQQYVIVSNGNSDNISIINTKADKVIQTVPVKLNKAEELLVGDSPNALALDESKDLLYVANGLDNAVAVLSLQKDHGMQSDFVAGIKGFIPTGAYPSAIVLSDNVLYIANLEGEGARIDVDHSKTYSPHQQLATISVIPAPDDATLKLYTSRVEKLNMIFRTKLARLAPRKGVEAKPVPERIGEPSVFKHVLYIIKENKTYDQVLGDMSEGNGMKSLCIFGQQITPNEHKLARQFSLLDNYYVSGKSSAEGHSWTDAAIVTDYIEKNVRAWFRSYPHVLADALAYNKEGFIWNNALDHGRSVRIYGEACTPVWKGTLTWKDIYGMYQNGNPFLFSNTTTISRIRPILSPGYPCFEGETITDQLRSDAFIKELKEYENMTGDQLPQLMVMALPADHTAGMREGYPTPRAMVADNDLALGKIIEAVTNSRFWDSTVIFITEDDSQSGWDHVSAYRTTGFVISPYSGLQKTIHTNYNQTCIVRTIEQILGIPPMNIMDATALPMFDCFSNTLNRKAYKKEMNIVPLDEMNKGASALKGKAKKYTLLSATAQFNKVDGGDDQLLNRIIWYSVMGKKPYPKKMAGTDTDEH